ncbi:ATP-binding protein [Actinoplanes solisilvae]|uniref:ATP-binding protein n=1 Tax=Actinoplanes solisilvae TaxID=2486853 RepID=UPI000FD82195|nr:LuxR family transcriptional regulator [Actinoplanes solisilvae]
MSLELRGRWRERATLDSLLRAVKEGHSRVLVLRGEAGVGKTALLDHLIERAAPARVVRAAGVEPETEIAYSALQYLCAPLFPFLDRLPDVQRDAVRTAFGLSDGAPPEPLTLGMAVLGLFAEAATDTPLVCVVDDVQWLDRMSGLILTFVARRLHAESVALLLAERTPTSGRLLDGLPEMLVEGLPDPDARALLDSALPGPVDARVRDRIVAETGGNPLALLELPRGLTAAELAFGFSGYDTAPLAGRVELGFQRRIAALPDDTRKLLLAAAVEPVGDVPLLWRALALLDVGPGAAAPAESDGLIELGARVRFRHPLVRSAVWRSAELVRLREVHAALAEVTDPGRDPDRRAWHRAHAAVGPDEQVAAELERSAGRAQARGGRSAAASFLERSAALTPDPEQRAARTLAAARARLNAGSPSLVPGLLAVAELGPLDPLQRADAARLRAKASFMLNPGRGIGRPLLTAASRLAPLDVTAARDTYLAALGAAVHAGRLGEPGMLRRVAAAARTVPPGDDVPGLFLSGLTAWSLDGYAAAVPVLRQALDRLTTDDDLELLWLAAMVALETYDFAHWQRLTSQAVQYARQTGALAILPYALSYRAGSLIFAGRFADALELTEEAVAAGQATGVATYLGTPVIMTAYRGQEQPGLAHVAATERDARERGVGRLVGVALYSRAVLHNGLGQYAAAVEAARQAVEYPDLSMLGWSLSELVEAAVRAGRPEIAAEARNRLAERTTIAGTPWALGTQALADALIGGTEDDYRRAIDLLERDGLGLPAARARLLFGEWLRGQSRRVEARRELRTAYDSFALMGAEAFAERAAAGETVTRKNEGLTAQESQIARLAVAGRTNAEIAGALFLSPRTVEWHLRKVFAKLGIASRRELARALAA